MRQGYSRWAAAAVWAAGLGSGLAPSGALAADPVRAVRPIDATLSASTSPSAATAPETRRIFVNFDAAEFVLPPVGEGDDATRNRTLMAELTGQLEGYGGTAADRDAVLQAVRADWEQYDVVITDRRPESGDYVMNQVGPNRPDTLEQRILGIAHLDCGDKAMRNDVSFSFHYAGDGHEPASVAMTISQEVAHAFGLEHVTDPADIMYPARAQGDPSFRDVCSPVAPADGIGIACMEQHLSSCGALDQQNAHRELMAVLGPARPDQVPPQVRIAMEFDAVAVQIGEQFHLAVQAEDDVLVDRVILHHEGEPLAEDRVAPFGWRLDTPESGTYEFYVEAIDASGNVGFSEPITVFVGVEPPQGMDVGHPYASGEDIGFEPSVGCSCRTDGGSRSPAPLLLLPGLALAALWRRRRNR